MQVSLLRSVNIVTGICSQNASEDAGAGEYAQVSEHLGWWVSLLRSVNILAGVGEVAQISEHLGGFLEAVEHRSCCTHKAGECLQRREDVLVQLILQGIKSLCMQCLRMNTQDDFGG